MIVSLFSMNLSAQVMRAEELEKYAKENYGDKWVDAAENLGSSLVLDKNQSLTYEQIINCGEQTKEQLYITLNHWFAESFNDANSVIKLNDKDAGVIIAKGFVGGIAQHIGGMTAYNVNIHPVIKVDIKDKKIRVTYTLQYYEVEQNIGGGWMGALLKDDDYILMRSQQILQKRIEIAEEKIKCLEQQNSKLQPKADFADKAFAMEGKCDIGQAAKILGLPFGRNTLFKKLREAGVFFANRNEPKQKYIDAGYFEMKEKPIPRENHPGFVVMVVLCTQKGLAYTNHLFGGKPSDGKLMKIA